MGIRALGIECSASWVVVWILTTIAALIAPFFFVRHMNKRLLQGYHLPIKNLIVFNVVEYAFIQTTLTMFFTTGRALCYVTDGQNGIEFAFTGWLALPILVVLSLKFDNLRDEKLYEINSSESADKQGLE